jgi:methyltransferase
MVFFHASWFLATITEFMVNNRLVWPPQAAYCLAFWLVAQPLRYWAIFSLGKFWNTRILILPGSKPIHQGPYQFIKHPNYLVKSECQWNTE